MGVDNCLKCQYFPLYQDICDTPTCPLVCSWCGGEGRVWKREYDTRLIKLCAPCKQKWDEVEDMI